MIARAAIKFWVSLAAGFLVFMSIAAQGQVPTPPAGVDSLKIVEILSADRYAYQKKDTARELLLLVGNVALKQETTLFYADSAIYHRNGRFVEAFGNVHINDNDSVHTYSDYLLYHTDTKIAILKKNVSLSDGKSILHTSELEYDVNQKLGIYRNGGKVVNGTSVLTSNSGIYYTDVKDAYFQGNVVMNDPQYKLEADSLLYNTESEIATFITKTYIEDSAKRTIVTSEGYYDLNNKVASFGLRPVIRDGPVTIIANQVDTDDNTGESVLTGNAVFKDTAQGVSVLANSIVSNRNAGTMLATQHPLMIITQDRDSTFITADTLYSGRLDELKHAPDSASGNAPAIDSVNGKPDSAALERTTDSTRVGISPIKRDPALTKRLIDSTLAAAARGDTTVAEDNQTADSALTRTTNMVDTARPAAPKASMNSTASINNGGNNAGDSANRFFRAYRNVKIFSDSMQAVCDSLFYSGADSIFRLFRDPVLWANNSQVTGDTIYMYTKNKKPDQLYVFEKGLMINRTGDDMYNQVSGNRLFGYFNEGEIDYMRAKGNAESIYYALDEQNKLIGINKASSDIIDMRFKDRELNRVVFISAVTGSMLPYRQATDQDKRLRNFNWQDDRRPKSKFELFGE